MCDCYSLAPLSHEFGTLAPRIRGNELSGRINDRILAHRWNSRDSDRETNRQGRILSQYILRDGFKPRSSSTGLSRKASGGFLGTSKNCGAARIRSNSEGISGNSGDNKPKKYESFDEFVDGRSSSKDGLNPATESGDKQESSNIGDSVPSSFDFLELKRELEKEEKEKGMEDLKEDELIRSEGPGIDTLNHEEVEGLVGQLGVKGGRKLMRRSNLLAKQVISIQSARSLGFVSQLWVDTRSIGDVVLVKDESVMENELKMIGLETLVGYNVVTSGGRSVGKVRGYTFNINSGSMESLELDPFGFSIIPSSLVSTYCLFVEDVLEIVSDTVVVHEHATSRVQRLTKGIWDTRRVDISRDEIGEDPDFGRRRAWSVHSQSSNKTFTRQKFPRKMRDVEDDWDLPMDY
ncbi:uncharacterized protein LOC103702152 isoform X2 [Phoenix dactylifera]|uniref:Uncharacterized protein LOC103702152 isoform X2 n=1 Tax=Phoenix dactylifera TaxID=42345 RepID=A0A8B7BPM3_PHODC|nr:uncharacterized protein LOC103702152 isoform X2 [Phoenix dactylifera]